MSFESTNNSRRDLIKSLSALGVLSLTQSPFENFLMGLNTGPNTDPQRLSWKAFRETNFEGSWQPTEIEGEIPSQLQGSLYRIGPGRKKVFATPLLHFFDGDAYLTALRFKNGTVTAQSQFLETVESVTESRAQKMLYNEYGTQSPQRSKGFKNSPNIHFVQMAQRFFALSESAHPYEVDPQTLKTLGSFDFNGELNSNVSFTAHPKFDPFSGDTFAFGITQNLRPTLKIFKISKATDQLSEISSMSLGGFFPIHDMMLTENYIIFVVSPLKVKLAGAALGTKPLAELLEYDQKSPLRILIFRKDGQGESIELKSEPSGLIFHNCNAFEDATTGHLVFDTIIADDASVFNLFKSWSNEKMPKGPASWITRFEIDLKDKKIISRTKISDGVPTDFPAIDSRLYGSKINYCYGLEAHNPDDLLAMNGLVCWDLQNFQPHRIKAPAQQVWGEPLYIPYPQGKPNLHSAAWILHLGYDADRDQTFLDIRKPLSLDLETRVWLGHYIPVGFHGSFINF